MMMDENLDKARLSDRILYALKLAVAQEDVKISEALVSSLEMAMTRNTGGGEFVERRDYPVDFEKELAKLKEIKSRK